ncbi:uncharacterized protein PGTG_11378 [Puccinia graminis f. sp. tritici CRL 75-36-700-3]|uniref:Uncharacterized protein n=1 Tax=Puccinia graminis f. sp. tritici (strain CRL 75-36-700-3 / race SCCL) TaxID=418459 RepID=E3KM61_PUCGT|nr:uncharacterized protein PGTG_11378 [Puccinia graminis f. sp. tritici CRL 75-36-700-3]EFP85209.2 hypothetical protein PGTG_11378 [Puccinia graminis f. sp. tritici CRL 75-36-700-3]
MINKQQQQPSPMEEPRTEEQQQTNNNNNNNNRVTRMQRRARMDEQNNIPFDEGRLGREIEAEHQLGLSNWIPLFLVILPNLGAMFFDGEPESWRDSLIFLLIVFFLYKISKAPWQLYASARTTRILNQARIQSNARGADHPRERVANKPYSKTIYPIRTDQYLTELKRNEMGFLLLATFSPALGIGLLLYLQTKLDLGLEYLNSHSTVLYLLSSLVKPLGHLHDRLLQRSRYLQSQLQFPVRLADQFNQTIDQLTLRLAELEQDSLSKAELEAFRRTQIETPLAALADRLAKYKTNDELHQLRAASRLSGLEETLAQQLGQLEKAEQALDILQQHEQSLQASPIHSLGKIVNGLLEPSSLPIGGGDGHHHPSSPNPLKSPHTNWHSDTPSPGSLKRRLSIDDRLQVGEEHRKPGYLGLLVRLLNPFHRSPSSSQVHDDHRPTGRRDTKLSAASDASSRGQRKQPGRVVVKLLMWPIEMTVVKPLRLVVRVSKRILRLPLFLIQWAMITKRPSGARRTQSREPDSRGWPNPGRRSPSDPAPRHPRPASPPSSASPVSSPDSPSSNLDILLHTHHHPSLPHPAKHRSWPAQPAFYDHVDDDNNHPVSYHDHLF